MAVSRYLGDREFKAVTGGGGSKDVSSGVPEVQCIKLDPSHEFLALVCDGVTDVMSSTEVAVGLNRGMLESCSEENAKSACTSLLQECFSRGSGDNLTAILIYLDWD